MQKKFSFQISQILKQDFALYERTSTLPVPKALMFKVVSTNPKICTSSFSGTHFSLLPIFFSPIKSIRRYRSYSIAMSCFDCITGNPLYRSRKQYAKKSMTLSLTLTSLMRSHLHCIHSPMTYNTTLVCICSNNFILPSEPLELISLYASPLVGHI